MNRSYRRRLTSVGLAVMLVLVSLPMPTQAEAINLNGPISATVFNPCTGEDVDLSGSLHLQVQFVANEAGGGHFRIQINAQGVGGVGVDSGTRYRGTGVVRFTIAAAGPTEHLSLDGHIQLVSQGSSDNLRLHFTLHFVANPNGVVEVVNLHGGCQ